MTNTPQKSYINSWMSRLLYIPQSRFNFGLVLQAHYQREKGDIRAAFL
jgi:hypothetical protein